MVTEAELPMAAAVADTSFTLPTGLVAVPRFKVEDTTLVLTCELLTVATRSTLTDTELPIAAVVTFTLPPVVASVLLMPTLVSAIVRAMLL